jgi:hypothetical protein
LFALADSGKAKVISVLMGFNPVELARKITIERWDKSFSDIALEMEKRSSIFFFKIIFFVLEGDGEERKEDEEKWRLLGLQDNVIERGDKSF